MTTSFIAYLVVGAVLIRLAWTNLRSSDEKEFYRIANRNTTPAPMGFARASLSLLLIGGGIFLCWKDLYLARFWLFVGSFAFIFGLLVCTTAVYLARSARELDPESVPDEEGLRRKTTIARRVGAGFAITAIAWLLSWGG